MPVAALFIAVNIIIGCYIAIRLGYGPPNWQTALNQVVRLITLQDYLNVGRSWLEKKAPWADKILDRFHVPKPIIIVDTTPEEEDEEEEIDEEVNEEVSAEITSEQPEEPVDVADVSG